MIGFNEPYKKIFAEQLMWIYPYNMAFKCVRATLFDYEAPMGYYYPPKTVLESEVPGEFILIKNLVTMEEERTRSLTGLSETELKYYDECIRFIREQFFLPTEEEIAIAKKIVSKNYKELSKEEVVIYEKFKSRFYKNPNEYSDKIYFDEEPVTLINPFVGGSEEKVEVIMNHYSDPYTANRIVKIITDFINFAIPNPDMTKETYEVVVAVAHWISACLINDYEYLVWVNVVDKDYYNCGKIDYYEYEKKDVKLEEIVMRHSEIELDLKYDDDGEVRTNSYYPGRYSFALITDKLKGSHKLKARYILPNALPHNIEALILETMVPHNKYGFTINASRFFNIIDLECHRQYSITDSLKTTFSDYRKHYLGT